MRYLHNNVNKTLYISRRQWRPATALRNSDQAETNLCTRGAASLCCFLSFLPRMIVFSSIQRSLQLISFQCQSWLCSILISLFTFLFTFLLFHSIYVSCYVSLFVVISAVVCVRVNNEVCILIKIDIQFNVLQNVTYL